MEVGIDIIPAAWMAKHTVNENASYGCFIAIAYKHKNKITITYVITVLI